MNGWASLAIYAVAIAAALFKAWVAFGSYILVAIIWVVPDQRIERTIAR